MVLTHALKPSPARAQGGTAEGVPVVQRSTSVSRRRTWQVTVTPNEALGLHDARGHEGLVGHGSIDNVDADYGLIEAG
jgi:hypothetical protein